MSDRGSRYWTETRLVTAARDLLEALKAEAPVCTSKESRERLGVAKDALAVALNDMVGYATDQYLDDSEGMCGGCGLVAVHPDEDCPEYGADEEEGDVAVIEDAPDPNVDVRLSVCCKAKVEMMEGDLRCVECGGRYRDAVRTTPQRWNED